MVAAQKNTVENVLLILYTSQIQGRIAVLTAHVCGNGHDLAEF